LHQISVAALRNLRRPDLFVGKAFIGGQWLEAEGSFSVEDPACGETIGYVSDCGTHHVDHAVERASKAYIMWRGVLARDRGAMLQRWARLLRKHAQDLAVILVAEQGKPRREALNEIDYAASFLDWFAAEGERAYGETIPSHKPACQLAVTMKPVGVVAAITPWNFPSAMIARKAAAALAAGCTVIVKPAPDTPFSALALAKLAEQAGIPAGVFQVVTGMGPELARRLISHPEVRALSFTGSTEVGRSLLEQAAHSVKKVSMELGGHAPFLAFEDTDVPRTAEGCVAAKFATSGQDCLAANRIYVQEGIYDAFLRSLSWAVERLEVGHGLTDKIDIGPMTRASVAENCRAHIRDALAKGARLIRGGVDHPLGGNFVSPTILAGVTEQMRIAREETFGPVAAILPFATEREVLARANNSEMGLAAYVYTRDLSRAIRVSDQLEYGMVAVNTTSFTGAPIPFGGCKQSGLGREGSRHGLLEFMEPKYVCIGGLTA
jgi:succinate-semialdehyde dehydrogenase